MKAISAECIEEFNVNIEKISSIIKEKFTEATIASLDKDATYLINCKVDKESFPEDINRHIIALKEIFNQSGIKTIIIISKPEFNIDMYKLSGEEQ